jgi:hypothetical protein
MAWLPGFVRWFKDTSAPGVGDDINEGYEVTDIIVDETNGKAYICVDNAAGAADWNQIDAAAGAGAVANTDFDATTFLYATLDDTPEPKTPAEVMAILSGEAGAEFLFNTQKIGGVVDPTTDQQAATKKYVDDNSGGTVDTSGTPVDDDFAKFTDADTIEGRSYSEVKQDLSLEDSDINTLITATKIDDLTAGDDNTDLDADTSNHGLLPKGDGDEHHFLDGNIAWSLPTVTLNVRKGSAGTVTLMKAVYADGWNASGWIEVELADADDAAKMPCIGLVAEASIGVGGGGHVIMSGVLTGLDTSGFSVLDELYVDTTAGDLTATKPTGSTTDVQKIGLVLRAHNGSGIILVFGAGRANDIPNTITLPDGNSINLQESITFTGATGENQIKMPDILADALSIQEGANKYVTFKTTNGAELVQINKKILSVLNLYFSDEGGEHILGDGMDLTIASGGDINLNATADVNLGGTLDLNENAIDLTTGLADTKYEGFTATFTAGENLTIGELCYFKPGDSKMWQCDGDALATTTGLLAIATTTISADASGVFLLWGFIRDDGAFAYTAGDELYVSLTPGIPTATIPPAAGDFVRVVGNAITADVIMFNPSNDIIERV